MNYVLKKSQGFCETKLQEGIEIIICKKDKKYSALTESGKSMLEVMRIEYLNDNSGF